MLATIQKRLDLKLIFWTTLFLLLVILTYALLKIPEEREQLFKQLDFQGSTLAYAVSKSAIGPILYRDFPELQNLIESVVGKESNIAFIRIFLKEEHELIVNEKSNQKYTDLRIYKESIFVSKDLSELGYVELALIADTVNSAIMLRIYSLVVSMGIMVLLLIVIQIIIISRTVRIPLKKLAQQADYLGKGDLSTSIKSHSKDELGALAQTLDVMRENLYTSYNTLDEYKNNLEKMVQERTLSIKKEKDYSQNIIKAMMEMLIVLDPDGKIKTINSATTSILGYEDKDLIGRHFDVIIKESEDENHPSLVGLLNNPQVDLIEKTYLTKNKEEIPVLFSATSMIDSHEKIQGIVCTAKDVSDIKKAEADKQQMHLQLIQSAKLASIGTLASGIAHELNNPLQIVQGHTLLITKVSEKPYLVRENSEMIYRASERMKKIINHLRSFAREGKTEDWQELPIQQPIMNSLDFLQSQLRSHGITIKHTLPTNTLYIFGDSTQLESVFQNLLVNSRDAFDEVSDQRNKVIDIQVREIKGEVEVIFSDNAIGIDVNERDHIFDPFFTTKEAGKGTGLGLSITRNIIESHKGVISLESQVGEGTTVYIKFPRTEGNNH